MNGTKEWYKSKTIWASLVTVVVGSLLALGVADLESEQEAIVELIMQIVTIVSGSIALVGRIQAKREINGGGGINMILLCLMLLFFAGCSKVQMSPEYRYQVESAAVIVGELDKRCSEGDETACREGLSKASETLNLIVDALYGRGGDVE